MTPYLNLEFIKGEPSKVWITANNNEFSGTTEDYINENRITELIKSLKDFPTSSESEVIFEAGKKEIGYSYIKLRFYCTDEICHTALQATLYSDIASNQPIEDRCNVTLKMQFEAYYLDEFRQQLENAIASGKGTAILEGIKPYTQNIGGTYA